MIKNLEDLLAATRTAKKRRIVVAYGQDSHSIESARMAVEESIAEVTLVGDKNKIERICQQDGISVDLFSVIDEKSDTTSVKRAVTMVRNGEADVLMKGVVPTDRYMRGILSKESGLVPPKATLSHVTVLEVPAYHKLLTVGDVAVIPYPDFDQKCAITKYLIATSRLLGVETPKVACIAPSEQLLPKVQSSAEAALIACMGSRGQLGKNVLFDGPMAVDVAIDSEAAQTKKLESVVAGDADCLLFPNIDAGNTFFKTCTKFAGASLAAMVMGAEAPCVLTSRGDTPRTKLYSMARACLSVK